MLDVMSTRALADDDYSITSEWQLEQPHRVCEDAVRLLTEKALHVTAILDDDGTIRYVSDSVEAVLGYAPGVLIG
jgi:PAS domain-containing protein